MLVEAARFCLSAKLFGAICEILQIRMSRRPVMRLDGFRADVSFFVHFFQKCSDLNQWVENVIVLLDEVAEENPRDKSSIEQLKQRVIEKVVRGTLEIHPSWVRVLRDLSPVQNFLPRTD